MPTKFKSNIPSSEITPKDIFLSRRDFMKAAGIVGAGALLAACAPSVATGSTPTTELVDAPQHIGRHHQL